MQCALHAVAVALSRSLVSFLLPLACVDLFHAIASGKSPSAAEPLFLHFDGPGKRQTPRRYLPAGQVDWVALYGSREVPAWDVLCFSRGESCFVTDQADALK